MTARRPVICLVTDRRAVDPGARTMPDELIALERWLTDAIGAVDLIQIRERDLPARELGALVTRLVERSRGSATRILVNDRVDVAITASADGIHLRGDAPPTTDVLEFLRSGSSGPSGSFVPRTSGPAGPAGPAWIVSRSIHTVAEVRLESDGPAGSRASLLLFGSVFPPLSKASAAVSGLEGLAEVVRASAIPVLAIGGVTPDRAASCRTAGAAGIAAITAFLPPGRSPDALGPAAAAAAFRASWGEPAAPVNPQNP